jgi:hypothetical protein
VHALEARLYAASGVIQAAIGAGTISCIAAIGFLRRLARRQQLDHAKQGSE